MSSMKDLAKTFLGRIRCGLAAVSADKGVYIGSNVHFECGDHIVLGSNVQIRPYCDLFASAEGTGIHIAETSDVGTRNRICGNVKIGKAVLLGPDNYISSVDHCYEDIEEPIMNQGAYEPHANGHSCLSIGDGSWVGCHCAIIGDVRIGKHCVIGANSVVTRDIPDYCVAVGAPAKVVKQFDAMTQSWVSLSETKEKL